MQTPMQELFDKLDFIFYSEVNKEKDWWDSFKVIHYENEKEQILKAYSDGYSDGVQQPNPNDNYYHETYKQN
jgi:hypothetical protein